MNIIDFGCKHKPVQIILLVLAGLFVYANSLHVPFVLDDVTIQSTVQKNLFEVLLHGGARRVTDSTFIINYTLHGFQVLGYHCLNLLIHVAAAITLYCLVVSSLHSIRQSFPFGKICSHEESPASKLVNCVVPLTAAMLFLVHPIQTQAVTYIVQRYTSLATLFYLLATLFFIKARISLDTKGRYLTTISLGGVSLVMCLLALGCKQIAATLPLMLLMVELTLFQGRLLNRRTGILFCSLCLVVIVVVLTIWHSSSFDEFLSYLHLATSEDTYMSRLTYFLTETRVVVTYVRLLFMPVGQSLIHGAPTYTSFFSFPVIASLSVHISLLVLALFLFKISAQNLSSDHKWHRGLLQRLISFGIGWFYVALIIESSIFPISDVIFEHRVYLPSIGFFIVVAAAGTMLLIETGAGFKTVLILFGSLSLLLGAATIARNAVWRDSLRLSKQAYEKYPDNRLAMFNLAVEYTVRDMPDQALPLFVKTIELNPNLQPSGKIQLGLALQSLNRYESRFTTGEEFINPEGTVGKGVMDYETLGRWESVIRNNLGLAYEYLGDTNKAVAYYYSALRANPSYDLAWYNLGLLSLQRGDRKQAESALLQLHYLNPSLAGTLGFAAKK